MKDDLWYDLSQMFIKHQNVGGVRMALQTEVRDYIVSRLQQERLRTLEEVKLERMELSPEEKKLAKEIGCLQRSEDQVLFYNQAVFDLEVLIAKLKKEEYEKKI